MSNINIEKIIHNHTGILSIRCGEPTRQAYLSAIKEIVEAVVDKCAEEAETEDIGGIVLDHDGDSIWSSHEIVNKKSILNVKQQIEYE